MNPSEQLEILLRGARFPDEVDAEAGAVLSTVAHEVGPPTGEETAESPGAGGSARSGGTSGDAGSGRADGDAESAVTGGSLRTQMTRELKERLETGRPLRVYLGVDPTATSLHVGHFVQVQKLRVFQKLGHQVVFLIGDYTALIGDPTGQSSERKRLTHDQVKEMASDYTKQAFRILDPEKTEVRYNSEWLGKLAFTDIVELASIFPLKWVISRRDFQDRLGRGESLRLHETLYCLMQGYDAYALECDVQVGGYDQYLNMLAGRWIQEHFGQKPHIPWTNHLLLGTDGRKMSKSFGNTINIQDSPEDMYGKSMRISDDLISSFIDLTTDLRPEEADSLKLRLADGTNPMDVKKEVAANLVTQYYDAAAADAAAAHFKTVIQQKSMPEEIEEIEVPGEARAGNMTWPDLLVTLRLAKSKGEVRRLMSQGGFYVEQEPLSDTNATYTPAGSTVIRLGKRRYYRLVASAGR